MEHPMNGVSCTGDDHPAELKEETLASDLLSVYGMAQPSPVPLTGTETLDAMQLLLDCLRFFKPQIEKALSCANDSHSFNDIIHGVMGGKYHIVPSPHWVMITEVHTFPNHKDYHVFIAAGDMDGIINDGIPQLEAEARKFGCKHISMCGREGWKRVLKPVGWTAPLTVMYKEVQNG
ncbi:MAG: hypothetical protein GKR86_00090 [Ilumatobacter sp.]|nr:hypothetical protein [Ilumatobacter sp.]